MAKRDSTKVMWRVQVRKSRAHKWVQKATYETRRNARDAAQWFREGLGHVAAFGLGNTKVVRYVRGQK